MKTKPLLFQPYTVRGITLKNRIVVSPMGTYGSENGCLTPFQFAHYERMAMGGAGLVIMEQTFVTRAGRVSNGDPGLWADSHIEPMARLVSEMKRYGVLPTDLAPDANVNVYQTDQRYWESLWHHPAK